MKYAQTLEQNNRRDDAYLEYLSIIDSFPEELEPKNKAEYLGNEIQDSIYKEAEAEWAIGNEEIAIKKMENAFVFNRTANKVYSLNIPLKDHDVLQKYLDEFARREIQHIDTYSDSSALIFIQTFMNYLRERDGFSRENGGVYSLQGINSVLNDKYIMRGGAYLGRLFHKRHYEDVLNIAIKNFALSDSSIYYLAKKSADSLLLLEKSRCYGFYRQKDYDSFVAEYDGSYKPLLTRVVQNKLGKADSELLAWYSDSKHQIALMMAEGFYEKGRLAETKEKYFEAIKNFKTADSLFSSFKDTRDRIADIKKKLSIGIGVVAIQDNQNCSAIGSTLTSSVISTKNAFSEYFEIADRSNLFDVMSEQALWQTGAVENPEKIQFGKLVGSKWIVLGKVEACNVEENVVPTRTVPAYFVQEQVDYETRQKTTYNYVTKQNEYGSCQVQVTHYTATPMNIRIFTGKKKVNVVVTLKVVDVETGKYVLNKVFKGQSNDAVEYADCGGCEVNRLSAIVPQDIVPQGCGGVEGLINAVAGLVNTFAKLRSPPVDDSMFSARRSFSSSFDMENQIAEDVKKQIKSEISSVISKYFEKY